MFKACGHESKTAGLLTDRLRSHEEKLVNTLFAILNIDLWLFLMCFAETEIWSGSVFLFLILYKLSVNKAISSLVFYVDIFKAVNSYFQCKSLRTCKHYNCLWNDGYKRIPQHIYIYIYIMSASFRVTNLHMQLTFRM